MLLAIAALTAFFWVPVVAERGYVRLTDQITNDHVQYWDWLLDPLGTVKDPSYIHTRSGPLDLHAVYRYSSSGARRSHPGRRCLRWGSISPALALRRRRGYLAMPALQRRLALGAALAVAGWWLTTTWSSFAWAHLALLRDVQFPTRALGPMSFGLALLGGLLAQLAAAEGPAEGPGGAGRRGRGDRR